MKIYTKTGDDGRTALFGGGRVPKDHARVDAYGTVDELNALLGWCVSRLSDPVVVERLEAIQNDLFSVGATLATPPPGEGRKRPSTPDLPKGRVEEMEGWIDEATDRLPDLKAFVLPGGTEGASTLHVGRTVCRRAERAVVHLAELEPVDPFITIYLNRLSDLLFTFARLENQRAGVGDVTWVKPDGEASPK